MIGVKKSFRLGKPPRDSLTTGWKKFESLVKTITGAAW